MIAATKKKILFISHQSTRTGAPMLLLNLLKWVIKNENDYEISVLLVKNGPLESEFKNLVKTYNLESYKKHNTFLLRWLHRKVYNFYFFNKKWDLIFSNSIVNGNELNKFKKKNIPIITYVHELKESIDKFLKRRTVQGTFNLSNHFICGSKLVEATLHKYFSIPIKKTSVARSFIDFKAKDYNKKSDINIKLRSDLNIDSKSIVIGMLGSFEKRKGYDLFIKTAQKLKTENIHFIWIGVNNTSENKKIMDDAIQNELKISFIPPTPEYLRYYHLIDIEFLCSREDPYPMVMVEASAFGIPIICFENAGGAQEFIDEKTGWIVPFEDTDFAASLIKNLANNSSCLSKNIDYIKEKSFKFHHVNLNAQKIIHQIEAKL